MKTGNSHYIKDVYEDHAGAAAASAILNSQLKKMYLSPLTLMSWDSGAIPTARDIHASRQRRLAELESSGGTALFIRNRPYSKDDILKAFDRLTSDDCLPYHLQVKQDAALLDFLETGAYSPKAHFGKREICGDETFLRWLAPHFAAAFAVFLKASIDAQQSHDLAALLREDIKIADEYEEEAWTPMRRELQKATSFLELYCDEKFLPEEEQRTHIKKLGAMPFLQIVRLKPEHLFYDETCEYTRLLNNATTRIDSVLPLTSYCIYNNLLNLKLEYSLEKTCSGNKDIFSGYGKKVRHIKCDGIPGRWAIHGKKTETSRLVKDDDLLSALPYVLMFIIFCMAVRFSNTVEPDKPHNSFEHLSDDQKKIIYNIARKTLIDDIPADSAVHAGGEKKSPDTLINKQKTDSNE